MKEDVIIRDSLYRTFVRFGLAKPYMSFWNPDADSGRGEEYRIYPSYK
jgi:hypothetical protein